MSIRIGSNIPSLQAQRLLDTNTNKLRSAYERLSSGLRINHASDDSGGLALASGLNLNSRVYNQGIHNINDSISLLNVAQSAMQELLSISQRQRELASQAASGTLNFSQRSSLSTEANELAEEFNRIVSTTSFNGKKILNGSATELRTQAGFGVNGSIATAITEQLSRSTGSGTFNSMQGNVASGALPDNVMAVGDVNGDGIQDLVVNSDVGGAIGILVGDGRGNFTEENTILGGYSNPQQIGLADFNGDGNLDIYEFSLDDAMTMGGFIHLNDGTGGFSGAVNVNGGGTFGTLTAADFNQDGCQDIISGDGSIVFGSRNGNYSTGYIPKMSSTTVADVNGDGIADVIGMTSGSKMLVNLGNGNGTFAAGITFNTTVTPISVLSADFNGDGRQDILSFGSASSSILYGNGDGTFKAGTAISIVGDAVEVADMNGDGVVDIVGRDDQAMWAFTKLYIGNGDGSFTTLSASADSASGNTLRLVLRDLNNDGAVDIMGMTDDGSNPVFNILGKATKVTTTPILDLYTQASARAAFGIIDATISRIELELGNIGAAQSRLASALNANSSASIGYQSAESSIRDVDVAEETSNLVSQSVLQKSGSAVLTQANQQLTMVLKLIKG